MDENELHPILERKPYPIPPILDDLDYADGLDFWRDVLKKLSETVDPDTARSIRRSINTIVGQIGDEYASILADKAADPMSVHLAIKKLEEDMRGKVKPVKQSHAHHGNPLEAFGTAVSNRSGRDIQALKKALLNRGYRTGGDFESMAPYSGGAHLGQQAWDDIAAHTDLLESVRQDKWVYAAKSPFAEILPDDISVEELADMYIDRIGEPQRLVNLGAWKTKDETAIRKTVLEQAADLGFNPFTTTDPDQVKQSAKVLGNLGVDVKLIRQQQLNNGALTVKLVPDPTQVPPVVAPKPISTPTAKPTLKPTSAQPRLIPDTAARKPGTKSLVDQLNSTPVKPSSLPDGMKVTKLAPKGKKTPKISKPKVPKAKNPIKGVPVLGTLAGVGLSYALGESPAEAAASNLPLISDIESSNTGHAERVGNQLFVDPRTNRIQPTSKEQVNKGLAYKNSKPVAVPYGSVAGKKDDMDAIKDGVVQLIETNKGRLKSAANEVKWGLKQLGIKL